MTTDLSNLKHFKESFSLPTSMFHSLNKMKATHRIEFYQGYYWASIHKLATFLIPLRNNQVTSQDFDVELWPPA